MEETRYKKIPACYQFEQELQDYLEGEKRPFVPTHAGECAFCRALVEDLEVLRAAVREMPLEEPSPAIWANIRIQLIREGALTERAGLWNWVRQLGFIAHPIPVAALACLLILGCFVTVPEAHFEGDTTSGLNTLPVKSTIRSMGFTEAGGALESVVQELEKNFRAREGSLAPDLRDTYENSLSSLDASIRDCRDSVQREPGNSLAHEYLLTAYSEKAEVLSSALEFDENH